MVHSKVAILICGCHLQAVINGKNWETIAFGGDYPTLEGRVVKGLEQVVEFNASTIIFGTGASSHDNVVESLYTKKRTLRMLGSIAKVLRLTSEEKSFLKKRIQGSILDKKSMNTKSEVRAAYQYCFDKGISKLVVVSSSWHTLRAHKEALDFRREMQSAGYKHFTEIIAVASHDCTEDVAISEPPHRGDRPKGPIHKLVRRADSLGRKLGTGDAFCAELDAFLQSQEEKLKG